MQSYLNLAFIAALVALGFYILRIQLANDLQSVQLEINRQAGQIQSLSTNVQTIADFLNQQIQAGQQPQQAAE